jgi:hypothetical protein
LFLKLQINIYNKTLLFNESSWIGTGNGHVTIHTKKKSRTLKKSGKNYWKDKLKIKVECRVKEREIQ